MKCMVTGGAGFIGTNLCEQLVQQGDEVIVIDNLSVSDVNVPYLKELGVKIVIGDIANYEQIESSFEGVDIVYHLAAMNRAQRSIEQPVQAHHVNITGTLHVLEAMRKYSVPKIINISSSSVYKGAPGLLKENMALAPLHPYGVGKLAAEHYVRVYSELFNIEYVTLRFFSVYGPRQLGTIEKAGVIAKFIHLAKSGKDLRIYGDGNQLRNFTFVKDVVRSVILAGESKQAEGEIINIANQQEISVLQLANTILDQVDTSSKIKHEPPLLGDPAKNPADVEKAQKLLGYIPTIDFKEGIKKTIQWYDQKNT